MTKADIVNEIARNTGIDKATVLTTLEAFRDISLFTYRVLFR